MEEIVAHLDVPNFDPIRVLQLTLLMARIRVLQDSLPHRINMSNISPQGQVPQNPNSMNNARAVYVRARNGRIYHINRVQVQMPNYTQVGVATQCWRRM